MSDPEARDRQSRSFGAEASAYERGRPSYPDESITLLLADQPTVVVDIGAGTGKLTERLVAEHRQVIAIEPDQAMLDQLRTKLPNIEAHVGTAESLPLPDASADAVVLGQAWHWVDVELASAEIGRVLRPGGTLGLIWNIRDTRAQIIRGCDDLFDTLPELADGGTIDMPYTTHVFLARR